MDQDDDRTDDRGPGTEVPAPVELQPGGLTDVAPAATSPVLLVAAMVTTFFVFLNDGFSGESTRWSDLAVFAAYLASGVVGLALPLVLLLGQSRRRRRGRSTPLVHVVVAAVTLAVGVPALTPAIVLTAPDAAQDLTRRFEPPTVAEQHFAGRDAEAELRRIGDESVRLLGGDPDVVAPEDLTDGYECELENAQRGISWHYVYDPRYLFDLDGRPLLAEGEQQLPGATADLEAVRATWMLDGITGVPSVDRADLLTPEADWLERGHAASEASVYLFTVCLVP